MFPLLAGMRVEASPELPSGQKRSCPGEAWQAEVSLRAGWRKVEDQLSPGPLRLWKSLKKNNKTYEIYCTVNWFLPI